MCRAEELSKQYKDFREQCGIKDPVMLNEIEEAYYEGYQQAEKDLELSLEDIKTIDKLLNQCVDCNNPYQEVLKRLKERKEK